MKAVLLQGAFVRAVTTGVAIDDALSVELAVRDACPLATFDRAIIKAFPDVAVRPQTLCSRWSGPSAGSCGSHSGGVGSGQPEVAGQRYRWTDAAARGRPQVGEVRSSKRFAARPAAEPKR